MKFHEILQAACCLQDGRRWRSRFAASFVEEITRRTGNAKKLCPKEFLQAVGTMLCQCVPPRFDVFCRMLLSALAQEFGAQNRIANAGWCGKTTGPRVKKCCVAISWSCDALKRRSDSVYLDVLTARSLTQDIHAHYAFLCICSPYFAVSHPLG